GHWVDWSAGPILGSTITLPSTGAMILVAFLAVFVQVTGNHLWDIICFLYHGQIATSKQQSTFVRQQQVLLRNNTSPTSTLGKFLELAWYWKPKSGCAGSRCLSFAGFSLLYAVGFMLAAIFASQVVDSSEINVLIYNRNCGIWDWVDWETLANSTELLNSTTDSQEVWISTLLSSTSYARTCFNSTNDDPQCKLFSRRAIDSTKLYDSGCPFESSLCLDARSATLQLDTGLIDTSTIFGLNLRREDELYWRYVTSCAPLTTDNYTKTAAEAPTGLKRLPGEEVTRYFYGEQRPMLNHTWSVSNYVTQRNQNYDLDSCRFWYQNNSGSIQAFFPIPELRRTDSDIFLFFLSANSVTYQAPVDDPIFSAHQPVEFELTDGSNHTYYIADSPATVIGCTQQVGSIPAIENAKTLSSLSALQLATVNLFDELFNYWVYDTSMVAYRSPPNLVAQQTQFGKERQLPLPDNQWAIEVEDWHNTLLTALKWHVVLRADAYAGFNFSRHVIPVNTTAERQICRSQKIKIDGSYSTNVRSNVNVFGLAFAIAMCCLIITLNVTPRIYLVCGYGRRSSISLQRVRTWISDEVLQVQRAAYEARNEGQWQGHLSPVPTTRRTDTLRNL
ncbi:hypothetical protein M501DRAFT_909713, partial [Patellaria atrata CBS 101060]